MVVKNPVDGVKRHAQYSGTLNIYSLVAIRPPCSTGIKT